MKMAKASVEDVKLLKDFFEFLENYFENGTDSRKPADEEGDFPELSEEEFLEVVETEFSRWTRRHTVGCSWRRVVWGFEILLANCCDPESDHLEWNQELRQLIENAESPLLEVHPFAADAYQLQEA